MEILGSTYHYAQFMDCVSQLVTEGKTTGPHQSEMLISFTALNLKRMERINKTLDLQASLIAKMAALPQKQIWYVITEAWCGDSAQNLPAIAKMADVAQGKIDLCIIFRDENPNWIEKYPTNGGKSIPKVIGFAETGEELFTWGPRPKEANTIFWEWKKNPNGKSWDDFEKELHGWYAKDKNLSLQNEFDEILSTMLVNS
jgi:Thioredoxin